MTFDVGCGSQFFPFFIPFRTHLQTQTPHTRTPCSYGPSRQPLRIRRARLPSSTLLIRPANTKATTTYTYTYTYTYTFYLYAPFPRSFALPFVLTYCTPAAEVNHTLYMYTFCVGETEVSCKLHCPSLYTYTYTYTNMYTNCIRPTLVRRRYVVLLRFTVYIYVY